MFVDVRRELELLDPGHNLAPPTAQWENYRRSAESALVITRILGRVVSLPQIITATTERTITSSLLVQPSHSDHVIPRQEGPHMDRLESIPTWALPPSERSVISHSRLFYVLRQRIFSWDGETVNHEA